MSLSLTVYETTYPDTPPRKRFVAVIDWNGWKGNKHLATFLYAETHEACQANGQAAIDGMMDKATKKRGVVDDGSARAFDEDEVV